MLSWDDGRDMLGLDVLTDKFLIRFGEVIKEVTCEFMVLFLLLFLMDE